MKIIYCLVSCLVLWGCRGSSKSETARPVDETQTPQKADTRLKIVAFGNSLTAGFGADPGRSYPDYLQKELDKRGYAWRVVNAGVSGDTTQDGLARIAEALQYKPAIVILEFGGNDGLRGLPVAVTRTNLEQMIQELQKSGVRVVLAGMTLPPNYGPDYIGSFEKVYKDLAAQYKVPLIPFLLQGVGGNGSLMQRDGLHPTAEGNEKVAENVMRVLEPLLSH